MPVSESLEWSSHDTELFHHLNTSWRSLPSHGPPVARNSLCLAVRGWVELGFEPGAARPFCPGSSGAVGREEAATLHSFSYLHGFLFFIRLIEHTGLLPMFLVFGCIQPSEKQKVPFVEGMCSPPAGPVRRVRVTSWWDMMGEGEMSFLSGVRR